MDIQKSERVCLFKQPYLNKASQAGHKAHNVQIQEVNIDKSQFIPWIMEKIKMKKYTSKHISSISMNKERNKIMIPSFSIWVLHTILHIRRIG